MRRAQSQASVRQCLVAAAALSVPAMTGWVSASGQDSKVPAGQVAPDRGTVLDPEFEKRLADPELNWPTQEQQLAAEDRETQWARCDTSYWQDVLLTKWFTAEGSKGPGAGRGLDFTAAVSAGGYDSIYHRWESDNEDYVLQFWSTHDVLSVMVEPIKAPVRAKLAEREVAKRTADAVARIVTWGDELLRNSTMKLEPTPYGYFVFFNQTVEQFDALRRYAATHNKNIGLGWLVQLTIRTDEYSFVFDFPKIGAGPTVLQLPVTTRPTNQPRVKTWFKERKPRERPSP